MNIVFDKAKDFSKKGRICPKRQMPEIILVHTVFYFRNGGERRVV